MNYAHLLRISALPIVLGTALIMPYVGSADTIVQRNKKSYGTITAITEKTVTLREGCRSSGRTIQWSEIEYVTIDNKCGGDQLIASVSPVISCDKGDQFASALRVTFKTREGTRPETYAAKISYKEGGPAAIVLPKGQGAVEGPLKDIDELEWVGTCESALTKPANLTWPTSYTKRK